MSLNLCCFNFFSRKRKVNAIENPETVNDADHDNEQILSNGIITKPPGSERDQTFDPQVSFETVKKIRETLFTFKLHSVKHLSF